MIDFFISIEGPVYLILYAIISVLVIVIAKSSLKRDGTEGMPVPEPTSINPLETALFAHGVKGAMRFMLFELWKNKRISFTKQTRGMKVQSLDSSFEAQHGLEALIMKKAATEQAYSWFFNGAFLKDVEKTLKNEYDHLKRLHLLSDEREAQKTRGTFWIALFVLVFFSGIKLTLGMMRDKPVAFLIFLLIASVFLLIVILKPGQAKRTSLGKQFARTVKTRFEYMKQQNASSLQNDDLLWYGIAAFGIFPMAGAFAANAETPVEDLSNFTLGDSERMNSTACGGVACSGTSCSGSSCSGSSCSGSSCGGGGCGGCGGGGD